MISNPILFAVLLPKVPTLVVSGVGLLVSISQLGKRPQAAWLTLVATALVLAAVLADAAATAMTIELSIRGGPASASNAAQVIAVATWVTAGMGAVAIALLLVAALRGPVTRRDG